MKSLKKKILFLPILGLFAYVPILYGTFVQEEWFSLLYFYSLGNKALLDRLIELTSLKPGQYIPFSFLSTYAVFYSFKANYLMFMLVGLSFHILSGYLLYLLVNILTKNKIIAIFSAFGFIVAPHHFQAVSWPIANFGYSLSAVFAISSLIFFFKWLQSDVFSYAVLSSVFLLISLGFKEIFLYLVVCLPLVTLIWKKNFKKIVKAFLIVLPVFLFISWSFWYLKALPNSELQISTSRLGIEKLLTLPSRSLAESLLPQQFIYFLAKGIFLLLPPYQLSKLNTTQFNLMVESTGALVVVVILCILVSYLLLKVYKAKKSNKQQTFKLFLSGLVFIAFSGFPYIFVDTQIFTLLQPRYVYSGVLFMSFLYFLLIDFFVSHKGRKLFLMSFPCIIFFLSTLNMSISMGRVGYQRKKIIDQISKTVATKKNKLIVFAESDKSYYGMPDEVKILPFQVGLGKVLAVTLYDKLYLPQELYKYETLLDLRSQGYFYDSVGGFGYFREFNTMKNVVRKNKIPIDSIYAFKYYANTQNLVEESEFIKNDLSKD